MAINVNGYMCIYIYSRVESNEGSKYVLSENTLQEAQVLMTGRRNKKEKIIDEKKCLCCTKIVSVSGLSGQHNVQTARGHEAGSI